MKMVSEFSKAFQRYWVVLLILLSITLHVDAATYLFNRGTSDYSIVVPTNASASEKTAAKELQSYIRQISDVTMPIVNTEPTMGRYIYVGYNTKTGSNRPNAADESYSYLTLAGNLYIWGGSDHGTMYGVFSFLENELGVRWYTGDCTIVPKKRKFVLKNLNHSESPSFQHRLDFYYTPLRDAVWCAHNKMNEQNNAHRNNYGNTSAFYGIHTFFVLVPPDTYFKTHPEYYSLIKGKRQYDKAELCLSNPEVLKIVKTNILKTIKEHPDCWVYDVSQMDNQNYCQCNKCSTIAKRYGGQSGLMLWFVNQVAEEVEKYYPTKKIGTFAYKYTRHAPTGIEPRKNVVIRLCDIECCFSHPLTDTSCEKNASFVSDMEDWSKLTGNIYVWDYVTHFQNYLIPYPDFNTLKENLNLFSQNGCIGVLEQGAHEAPWAEFSEMRQWIISKLLWNCNQDVDALARDFCYDYYGNAGSAVYEYYQMVNGISPDVHVTYWAHYEKTCYNDEFLSKARSILEQALLTVQNDSIKVKRLNRVLAQVYYMYTCRHLAEAKKNGIYQKLKDILSTDPTNIWEGHNDLDEHINKQQGYT